MASILVVEDEAPLRESIIIALKRSGHAVTGVGNCADGVLTFERGLYDLVIVDLRLPDGDGLDLLRTMRSKSPDIAALVVTAFGDIQTAVESMRLGAHDFLQKPFKPERLAACVLRALEHRRLKAELRRRAPVEPQSAIVGIGTAMLEVRRLLVQSRDARIVLVTGETGTGKDLVARAVHAARDPDAPFVVVNCGALPASLVESELFGHSQGAFTGATRARRGLLADADGGTVFFDEIGEVPLTLQARLLRFLETGEVRAVGADQAHRVDCRIIAATNRDLGAEVREGRFRQDLLYRLDVFRVAIPPLRERLEDMPSLCEHLLRRLSMRLRRPIPELDPEALESLAAHRWPGNVRELEHSLERAMLMSAGEPLSAELLLAGLEEGVPESSAPPSSDSAPGAPAKLAQVERRHILSVIEIAGGDRTRAAALLGISRSTLRRKLITYGVHRPRADSE